MTATYLPIHKLASGGMADVFLGLQLNTLGFKRLVAIKKIKPGFAQDQDFVTMFRDEANVCQYLQHGNIVQIVDFSPMDQTLAIVLEYVPGVNLLDFINAHRALKVRIPIAAAVHIACEILRGLAYVHTRVDPITGENLGIIHRDITPTNVILSAEGEVKLTDFGIAKARDNQHHTQIGMLKGKLNYVSPEQFDGKDLDPRTDVYSLGLLLYEMLTNRRLYDANSETELVKIVTQHNVERNPAKQGRDIDDDLCSIVMTAIAIKREERYGSANELLRALRDYHRTHLEDFDLQAYVRRMMANELKESREIVQAVLKEGEKHTPTKKSQLIKQRSDQPPVKPRHMPPSSGRNPTSQDQAARVTTASSPFETNGNVAIKHQTQEKAKELGTQKGIDLPLPEPELRHSLRPELRVASSRHQAAKISEAPVPIRRGKPRPMIRKGFNPATLWMAHGGFLLVFIFLLFFRKEIRDAVKNLLNFLQ